MRRALLSLTTTARGVTDPAMRRPQYRWSHFYAAGREILAYLKRVAAKYRLERFLRFGHKLTAARWNDDNKQWHLSFDLVDEQGNKHGEVDKVADVVIQGMGGLSRWDWPAIPGIHDYKVRARPSLTILAPFSFSPALNSRSCPSPAGNKVPLGVVPGRARGGKGQDRSSHRLCASLPLTSSSSRLQLGLRTSSDRFGERRPQKRSCR